MNIPKKIGSKVAVDSLLKERYPCRMQLYRDPPETQITLYEFEQYAIERLKVLRTMEQISLKGTKTHEEYAKEVETEIRKSSPRLFKLFFRQPAEVDEVQNYETRKIDHISHYILRFAYCQSEELKRWFIAREFELFKIRYLNLSSDEQKRFIDVNHLNYKTLDYLTQKKMSFNSGGLIKSESTITYYRVKWTNVLDLVRNRKVYLEAGIAYITASDLISVLGSVFRSNLSHNLAIMSHKLSVIQSDERFKRLVNNLHNTYTGKSYTGRDNDRQVSLENLDSLSKTSFPLCMKQLHSALKTHHHLRHFGRQQFSLFLKGVGLSLEDALIFWRTEFTKKMDSDQFEKKYAYNFRHNYGKEGKRANYTPYSCGKIIASSAGPGEYHGCPFKHNDVASLKQTFASLHINPAGAEEVLDYVKIGQYQLACGKFFEVTHKAPILTGVNHPNQYFEESQKILATAGKSNDTLAASKRKSTSQPPSTSAKRSVEECFDDTFDVDLSQLDGM